MRTAYIGGHVFDGERLHHSHTLCVSDGIVDAICAEADLPSTDKRIDLNGGVVLAGFVDLQLNGGGGAMFDTTPTVAGLKTIAQTHWALGTRAFLPTLITSSEHVSARAIMAVLAAIDEGVPGIVGLHLEGPHISKTKAGAHDARLVRTMQQTDLEALLRAAEQLPHLMVTVAPEAVSASQVKTLADAGIVVSLGHSNAGYEDCTALFEAGARSATHLFNAMSPLTSRKPGLVGAALDHPDVACGVIADGVHVHPRALALACATKPHNQFYLISDAMAVAGTDAPSFEIGDRKVFRSKGELRLADGTLAGADLTLERAVSVMINDVGIPAETALQMATQTPSRLLGLPDEKWRLMPGVPCEPVVISI